MPTIPSLRYLLKYDVGGRELSLSLISYFQGYSLFLWDLKLIATVTLACIYVFKVNMVEFMNC